MLRLLQSEIEEGLITLHGDLAKTTREATRTANLAKDVAKEAESWTDKAQVAVDHNREDLARAALLARESERQRAEELKTEAKALSSSLPELEEAIAALETKRVDITDRIEALRPDTAAPPKGEAPRKDSHLDKRMDRIDEMERRAGFAATDDSETLANPGDIEAEIAGLQQSSALDAELAAMKASPKKPARKKK